jgi:hypothetical protein
MPIREHPNRDFNVAYRLIWMNRGLKDEDDCMNPLYLRHVQECESIW